MTCEIYSCRTQSVIESLNQASTIERALNVFEQALGELGADYFGVHFLPRPEERLGDICIAAKARTDWHALYADMNFCQHDPSVRHSRRTVLPFDWAAAPYEPETEPEAKAVRERARDFNMHKGIMVPIPSPSGVIGGVWVGGPRFDERERHKPLLHLLGLNVFHRLQQLSSRGPQGMRRLTDRQREVLLWAAEGKTAWEIGGILNLSRRTVETYFYQACKRLGAANRTQAIAILGGLDRTIR